ncbi:MAG: hypothetical protein ABSF84_05660 [Acidimicrobiales bacterium]|jgi:hypothetical protein
MTDPTDDHSTGQPLSERLLDLFVFLPTGLAVAVAEELPRLAERGRERLGVRVDSARAVGKLVVDVGGHELKKRSAGVRRPPAPPAPPAPTRDTGSGTTSSARPRLRTIPRSPATGAQPVRTDPTVAAAPTAAVTPVPSAAVNGHVPEVSTLAIPGFDTLSASQVVQRLDGLSRSELVSVRAYETSTRGRRTILSRVDQLLDERS